MNRLRLRKAFTVVEMVIVIAVIAILSAVLIPTISGVIQKANVSADQQFAASLNIQLALWEVDNGEIKNESDLRDAVNAYYGTDEVPDYYSTITPKAAKTGYHIWYDVTNKQVVAGTYEDIGGSEVEPLAKNDAGGFANSYRTVTTGKGIYFLMDHGGSEGTLAHHVSLLDQCNVGNYTTAIDHLGRTDEYIEADQYLSVYILNTLKTTAIANDHGIFAYNNSPSAIYIPATTQKISANGSASIDFSDIDFIVLPKGVSVASNALIKLVSDANGAWNRPDATTIYVDAAEADLKNLFAAESTNGVIQLPNGDRYIVDGADILKLTESGTENAGSADYTDKVKAITVTVDDGMDNTTKARIVDNTLYIAWDFTGDITVNVEAFADEEKTVSVANPGKTTISIEAANTSINNSAVNVSAQNAGDGTFTVTVQGEDYIFDVVNVGIDSIQVASIGGKTPSDYTGNGYSYTAVYQLGYTSSSSFPVVTTVTPESSYVEVNQTVEMSSNGYVTYASGNLTIKSGVSNQRTEVTFSCGDKSVTCALNLVDNTNSPFESSQLIKDCETYMGTGNAYFGTKNATLDKLFASKAGVNITDQLVTYTFDVNGWTSQTYTAESWNTTAMTFGSFSGVLEDVTIKISVGGKEAEVTVNLVKDGYNVTNLTDWRGAGTDNNIVLLTDLTGDNKITSYGDKKSLSSKNIYGNLKTINITTAFTDTSGGNGYFLEMSGGGLYDLLIEGPAYTSVSAYMSDGKSKGTYIAGVQQTGETVTINDCYISGFRSPIRMNGGTLNMTDTVLKGGYWANIYAKGGTINANDVKLIQYKDTNGYVGAGIHVDSNVTLNLNHTGGDFIMSTYLSKSDANNVAIKNIVTGGSLITVTGYKSIDSIVHGDYAHMGILIDKTGATCNLSDNLKTKYSSSMNFTLTYKVFWESTVTPCKIMGLLHSGDNNICNNRITSYSASNFLTDPIRTN